MLLYIQNDDKTFEKYLLDKIGELKTYPAVYLHDIYDYIYEKNFKASFIANDTKEYRGEACRDEIIIHKSKYETYDSLCWLFFHELGHLMIINSPVYGLMKSAKGAHYKSKGFDDENKLYWNHEKFYEYYMDNHDEDPEEYIVSLFATYIIGENYDRSWWYKRIEKIDNNCSELNRTYGFNSKDFSNPKCCTIVNISNKFIDKEIKDFQNNVEQFIQSVAVPRGLLYDTDSIYQEELEPPEPPEAPPLREVYEGFESIFKKEGNDKNGEN